MVGYVGLDLDQDHDPKFKHAHPAKPVRATREVADEMRRKRHRLIPLICHNEISTR